jgi:hypothetical protein
MWWRKPSNDRDWSVDQALLPEAKIEGDFVHIRNIRNSRYRSVSDYDVAHYDKTFDVRLIEKMWLMIEPFSIIPGMAHSLVCFGFSNGDYVAISPEIRKKRGEVFSAVKGCFRYDELMYVIADERDVLELRGKHRNHDVYLFPITRSKDFVRGYFISMVQKANDLAKKPEFFNTFGNNCGTSLRKHAQSVEPHSLPFGVYMFLPAYAYLAMRRHGYMDSSTSALAFRRAHLVSPAIRKWAGSPAFSKKIREESSR